MTTLTLEDYTPPAKTGLADPNWKAPDGWPKSNAIKATTQSSPPKPLPIAMKDHGGGEKLLRELRGKRIKSGPMAERVEGTS